MHNYGTTTMIVAAAARQARERLQQDEEELIHYSDHDLAEDWEFKIVRSATGAFRKPEVFAKLLDEEARFGWVLLEKLDDSRVRFKRRAGSRGGSSLRDPEEDPYRSVYGVAANRQAAFIALAVIGGIVFIMGLVLFLVL